MFKNVKKLLIAVFFLLSSTSFLIYSLSAKRKYVNSSEYGSIQNEDVFFQKQYKNQQPNEINNSEKNIHSTASLSTGSKSVKSKSFASLVSDHSLTMGFDIILTSESFEKCHDEQLNLQHYNKGYNELYNFFNMLGTVFGFIASDVREKIDILEKFRTDDSNPNQKHYVNVEDMMLYEIDENKKDNVVLLGSRTLLRLHRALEFTFRFLEELSELPADGKVSTMALKVYGETLAKFHPFLIRNAAKIAMYALPSRADFMKKVAAPGTSEEELKEATNHAVASMRKVYDEVEALYTKHDLHGLP